MKTFNFKVGDKLTRSDNCRKCGTYDSIAVCREGPGNAYIVVTALSDNGSVESYDIYDRTTQTKQNYCSGCFYNCDSKELVQYDTNNGGKEMARRTFRQVKETVDTKRGSLWQEECDDGTQPYMLITKDLHKGDHPDINYRDRKLVEEQPEWFVEVFQVEPQYMTADEIAQWEAFKSHKPTIYLRESQAKKTTTWTPERRARQSEIMKKRYAAKARAARRTVR